MPKNPPKDPDEPTQLAKNPPKLKLVPPLIERPGKANQPIPPPPAGLVRDRKNRLVPEDKVYGLPKNHKKNRIADDAAFTNEESEHKDLELSEKLSNNLVNEQLYDKTLNRSPKQLTRQERAFELSVIYGMTNLAIAAELGVTNITVAKDIQAEISLRSLEFEEVRTEEKVRQLMIVQRLMNDARESRNKPGTGAYAAYAKAAEMRARLLGLDAPTKIELGVSQLLEAINILPEERQHEAYERIVSPSSDLLALTATEKPEQQTMPDETANKLQPNVPLQNPARDIAGQIAQHSLPNTKTTGPVIDADGTIEGEVSVATSRALEPLADLIQHAPPVPGESMAERSERLRRRAVEEQLERRNVVAAAMGAPQGMSNTALRFGRDPITGNELPAPTLVDPLLSSVEAHRDAALDVSHEAQAALEATQRTAHMPGTPVVPQDTVLRATHPDADPASRVMLEPFFLKLSPAAQAEVVRAARQASSEPKP